MHKCSYTSDCMDNFINVMNRCIVKDYYTQGLTPSNGIRCHSKLSSINSKKFSELTVLEVR